MRRGIPSLVMKLVDERVRYHQQSKLCSSDLKLHRVIQMLAVALHFSI